MFHSSDLDELKSNKIKSIVNCGYELKNNFIETNDFSYLHLKLEDDSFFPIEDYFLSSADYIHSFLSKNEAENVLVHCKLGRSRSCCIILSYLISKKHYSLNQALKLIEEKKPIAFPNPGFIVKLKELEKKVNEKEK